MHSIKITHTNRFRVFLFIYLGILMICHDILDELTECIGLHIFRLVLLSIRHGNSPYHSTVRANTPRAFAYRVDPLATARIEFGWSVRR